VFAVLPVVLRYEGVPGAVTEHLPSGVEENTVEASAAPDAATRIGEHTLNATMTAATRDPLVLKCTL
jgi:hypothetical protein